MSERWRRAGGVLTQAAAACALVGSAAASAQTWQLQPSLSLESTLTDNVNLTATDRKSDWVNQITPTLLISEKGAHTTFGGTIAAPILLYARTASENNAVRPEVNLIGTAELYPQLFFVDASVLVSQEYLSPFGARPQNLVSATENRLTAQYYRVSPYLKGQGAGGLSYELRDNNIWTRGNQSIAVADRSYTNEIVGNLTRDPRPLGWALDYDRTDTRFSRQDPQITEIGRLNALWRPDPLWELSAGGGYEDNRYPLEDFAGATYGVGVKWHPTDRTNLDASWEHRFFGASYHVTFDHHTPLTVWSFAASRDITTYPQQLGTLSSGGDVNALLNSLFASRITDPIQRQALVDQFVRERGLPSVLSSPLSLVTQQITLEESLRASAGLLGARNSILLTAYRTRSEPVGKAGDVLAGLLILSQIDNTQTGANVVWTYKLTPLYTLATNADWFRTVANDASGIKTQQGTLQTTLSAPISVLTNVFAGARYQHITSNAQDDVNEAAIFVGISHVFK